MYIVNGVDRNGKFYLKTFKEKNTAVLYYQWIINEGADAEITFENID